METGVHTYADLGTHPPDKRNYFSLATNAKLMEEIELADQLEPDVFAVG